MNIRHYQDRLARFAAERDWDQFHSPKNLVMALAGEVGELLEIFQWVTEEHSLSIMQDEKSCSKVNEELADIAIYLLRLCDRLNVDIEYVVSNKIDINEKKYPIELAKGNAIKYNQR